MTEDCQISVRGFRWPDLPDFSNFLNRLGQHGFRRWPEFPDALRSDLEMLRLDPEQDVALLWSGGDLCGYAAVHPEPDIDRIVVSIAATVDCSSGADELLDFAASRAGAVNASQIHVALRGSDVEPAEAIAAAGFHQVAANIEMILQRADAGHVGDEAHPAGYSVRPMRSSAEVLLLTRLQNTAFENHWGFSKNTPDEIQARLDVPESGPEHVLFAESPEGDVAGYVWTALEWHQDHTCGKIWMTGVSPEFRGRGVGRAIVAAGVRHLLSEGAAGIHLEVMEANVPAIRIYERMGFKPHATTRWFEKRV